MSKRTPKKKITQHSCCSMLTREENLKAIRGNGYRFVPKVARSLPKTIMLVVRSSGLWEASTQTCPKWDKICTTACWYRSMKACQVSWISDEFLDLLEFKNEASQCFTGNQRCPGFWNSFPFLPWDLSKHPRTHIWFFNQFICTGACACSPNLNYAHKCIENSVNT